MITGLFTPQEAEAILKHLDAKDLCFTEIDGYKVGGTKCLEANIFIGAFNYLDRELLVESVKGIEPLVDDYQYEDMQVMIKGQDEDMWHTHVVNEFDVDCFW